MEAHLPLSLCCLVLELYLPVFGIGICTVMHSEDDGAGQQSSGRPTAHHRGQECLGVFHGWPRRRAEIGTSDICIASTYYVLTEIFRSEVLQIVSSWEFFMCFVFRFFLVGGRGRIKWEDMSFIPRLYLIFMTGDIYGNSESASISLISFHQTQVCLW